MMKTKRERFWSKVNKNTLNGRGYDRNGELNGRAKLTKETVSKIRSEYTNRNGHELSKKYDISPSQILRIIHNTSWRSD